MIAGMIAAWRELSGRCSVEPGALETAFIDAKIQPGLDDRIYLVRPDGYLACSTRAVEDVSSYLGRIAVAH